MSDFYTGKLVYITGGSSGIGLGFAVPRAYDITVVYRLAAKDTQEAEWQVARIVVSRNGIRRVATLNGA